MGKKKSHAEWTTVEEAILREIWESSTPLRLLMHRLPRHSLRAALIHGQMMGLPSRARIRRAESPNKAAMREAIKASAHHAITLAEKVGVSRRTAQQFLKAMHDYELTHISGWRKVERNGPPLAMYSWGKGEDVPMPKPAAFRDRFRKRTLSRAGENPFKQLVDYSKSIQREAA